MSQYDFGNIDPYVVDGDTLASMLNRWRDALYTLHRGQSRPSYIVPGMAWVDDSAGDEAWTVKVHLNATLPDTALFLYNSVTGEIRLLIEQRSGVLPGTIIEWAGTTPPTGYLLCDGSEYSRISYPDLFNAIGIAYGAGDGTSTFRVPDKCGRTGVGRDRGKNRLTSATMTPNGDTLGATGGQEREQASVNVNVNVNGGISGQTSGALGVDVLSYAMDGPNTLTPVTGGDGRGGGADHSHANVRSAGQTSGSLPVSGSFNGSGSGTGTTQLATNVQPSIVFDYYIKY